MMNRIIFLVSILVIIAAFPTKALSGSSIGDTSHIPGKSSKFLEYEKKVEELCRRNRECYFPLQKEVVVGFFLMEDGVIRSPRIIKSSSIYSHDMSCIDAVLCASPLPPPPIRSSPLAPPISKPDGILITLGNMKTIMVESLPSGPITVTFEADKDSSYRLKNWNSSNSLELPLIPLEMGYRYPNAFDKKELMNTRNYFRLERGLDKTRLEKFRYPWVEFVQSTNRPKRESILKRLMVIQTYASPESGNDNWKDRWN